MPIAYSLISVIFLLICSFNTGHSFDIFDAIGDFLTENIFGIPAEPEEGMTVPEVISYHGYKAEVHTLTTTDGYILSLHRVPYGKSGPGSAPRQPVLLLHGLWFSSIVWVWNTPDKNLAYILADAGYDVWLGNVRGNEYGRKHTKLSPDSRKFWNFSWDEMALIDLPAMMDLISNKTGFPKISIVAHSMGSSMAFALLATKPEYNQKVNCFAVMGPGVYLGNMKSPVKLLGPLNRVGSALLSAMKNGEFDFNSGVVKLFTTTGCAIQPFTLACTYAIFAAFGVDYPQLNQSRLSYWMDVYPTTTSVRTVQHFGQLVQLDRFCSFDFGRWRNNRIYHQPTPPEYNVTKVNVPVALFWSHNDLIAVPEDVARLALKLPNLVLNHEVNYTAFTHPDFVWALDVKSLVYDYVVAVLNKFK